MILKIYRVFFPCGNVKSFMVNGFVANLLVEEVNQTEVTYN